MYGNSSFLFISFLNFHEILWQSRYGEKRKPFDITPQVTFQEALPKMSKITPNLKKILVTHPNIYIKIKAFKQIC